MNILVIVLIIIVILLFFTLTTYSCFIALKDGKKMENVNLFGNLLKHESDTGREYSLI